MALPDVLAVVTEHGVAVILVAKITVIVDEEGGGARVHLTDGEWVVTKSTALEILKMLKEAV